MSDARNPEFHSSVCFLYIGYQDTIQLSPAVAHITSTPSTKITTATNPIGTDKIDSNCLPVSCTVDEQRIMHVSGKIAFSSEVIIVSSGHSQRATKVVGFGKKFSENNT